ncbi:MAG: hypothetical protein H6733_16945, partial [Alphaproteobacteria bacterium]|nr:hypothetical protein [Alphaproteobacteria bacterium]
MTPWLLAWLALAAPSWAQDGALASTTTRSSSGAAPGWVRNRLTTGAWFGYAQTTGDADLEVIVSDALTASLAHRDGLDVRFLFAGRTGIRTLDGRLDDPRVRALGV